MALDRPQHGSEERPVEAARRLSEVQQRLLEAARNAMPEEEHAALQAQERAVAAGEAAAQGDAGLPLDHPAVATYDTPEQLGEALTAFGMTPEQVQEVVEHERAHYDEAVAQGFDPVTISVVATVSAEGRVGFTPFVRFETDPSAEGEDALVQRARAQQVLEAPGDPSEQDEQLVDALQRASEGEVEQLEEAPATEPDGAPTAREIALAAVHRDESEARAEEQRILEELRAAIAAHDADELARLTADRGVDGELREAA